MARVKGDSSRKRSIISTPKEIFDWGHDGIENTGDAGENDGEFAKDGYSGDPFVDLNGNGKYDKVIEFEEGERWLQMNEGLDSYQSKWSPKKSSWVGGYYDLFALAPIYAECQRVSNESSSANDPIDSWILGYAAGTALHSISAILQDRPWNVTGIEIDSGLRDVANRWLPLPAELLNHLRYLEFFLHQLPMFQTDHQMKVKSHKNKVF